MTIWFVSLAAPCCASNNIVPLRALFFSTQPEHCIYLTTQESIIYLLLYWRFLLKMTKKPFITQTVLKSAELRAAVGLIEGSFLLFFYPLFLFCRRFCCCCWNTCSLPACTFLAIAEQPDLSERKCRLAHFRGRSCRGHLPVPSSVLRSVGGPLISRCCCSLPRIGFCSHTIEKGRWFFYSQKCCCGHRWRSGRRTPYSSSPYSGRQQR